MSTEARAWPDAFLQIPDAAWDECDGSDGQTTSAHLIASVIVGTDGGAGAMHFEAFAVETVDDLQQWIAREDDLDAIYAAVGGSGPWCEWEIRGRKYVIVATPFCE